MESEAPHGHHQAGLGRLVLAGTPIGDSRDASPRLMQAIVDADIIAAEDTRRFRTLLLRLGVQTNAKVVSYFEGNEAARTASLADSLVDGSTVVLVTDAGMPSVSDPGYRLVVEAIKRDVPVTAVPGPSAVLAALAVSGLAVDRFCFEGFAPRKKGERARALAALAGEERTMVFFEAPHRLADFLLDASAGLGADRTAAVCRELTKTYEEVRRGTLAELAEWAEPGVRGEITVVISGAEAARDEGAALDEVTALIADGARLSEAVTQVARQRGVPRNGLYQAALDAKKAAKP